MGWRLASRAEINAAQTALLKGPAIAVAAHPGLTRTDLARYLSPVMTAFYVLVERPLAQRAAIGALGTLRAATDPAVHGGEYYGPVRWRGERGYPERISSSES